MADTDVVIELRNITKKFGDFVANDNISLKVRKGEVHAILGENGAGKSTLMNQLFGLIKPTSGGILVNGEPVTFNSSRDAMKARIGMVHQHFMLISNFTVTENMVLGNERVKGIRLDMEKARKDVIDASIKYGMEVDPDAKIEDISLAMQQRVEILKALYKGLDVIILDEPTASLTPQEIDELMYIIGKMVEHGKSVIIITHKLKEIKRCADVCTIIRQGKYVDTVNVKDTDEEELAELMVGRKVASEVDKKDVANDKEILVIKDLHAKDYRGMNALNGLSLTVHSGEIVGLAGIDGNGQTELVECITGLRKATSGVVTLDGKDIFNKSPRFVFDNGVSSIPADRQKHGLVLDYTVEENLILQNYATDEFSKNGFLDRDKISKFANECIEKYDIRPAGCSKRKGSELSGGNQQKVVIAREVENNKDLLIAFNPTRGLDVGAIEFVHKYLVEQRNKGKAILLVSFELDEILTLSDKIKVIYNGNINMTVDGKDADEKTLGLMMVGGKENG